MSNQDMHTPADLELAAELAEVEQQIRDATADLFPPFSQMVAAQLRNSHPLTRAAVVLTAGVAAPDTNLVHSQRVFLAAALEMLHLAITVHMQLGDAADTINRSLLGSAILAGDYCFSRSAGLAVRTGDPTVVEIFSDALKRVSEGQLRHFFNPMENRYSEDQELFVSGVTAAMHLAHAPDQVRFAALQVAEALANPIAPNTPKSLDSLLPDKLTPHQHARWLALLAWWQDQ